MQSNPVVVICSNWRTYNIYNITLSIPCSGVFCAWVVQRQSDNRFCDHPSFVQKSFIWPLLAAFSSAYILAFLYISFHDSHKFFDLCKVIHSKSISSKSISLIFLPPPSSFFAILPWFFELYFVFGSHFVSILLSFFYLPEYPLSCSNWLHFCMLYY